MTYSWTHIGPVMTAAFLASLVEAVEALTIVLAVGVVRGWRPALAGTGMALALLAVLVATFGPSLSLIPIAWLQIAIGVLLARWIGGRVFGVAISPRLAVFPATIALAVAVALLGALPLRLLGRVRPAEILRGE